MAGDNTKTLVRMANQIAAFFAPYPEEEGVAGVHLHLHKFWSPVMRRDLAAHIEHGGEGLSPIVLQAFQRLTDDRLAPTQREFGEMTSDAG
ncbi:formate dehydrogenase subunit delta [Terrihabitans sp. B22-R8]|uniref:formate dehydrogenase subunit delta n=1 Tax=Terrihabitans sp. B22-R8 TaxID=3425128 RepID=UPI00403C9B11